MARGNEVEHRISTNLPVSSGMMKPLDDGEPDSPPYKNASVKLNSITDSSIISIIIVITGSVIVYFREVWEPEGRNHLCILYYINVDAIRQ